MNNKDGRISLNVDVLKAQRKQRGLSQEKVAEACLEQSLLVSVSSIKRAELGMNVLYRTATQLATFYGISVELLLIDNEPATSPAVLSGSHTQNKNILAIVIEMKNPTHKTKIHSMLDGTQKHCHQQGNYITIDWHISEDDTQVYKRIQCLCTKLKSTFQSDIRLFIESTIMEHNSEANLRPSLTHNKRSNPIVEHSV